MNNQTTKTINHYIFLAIVLFFGLFLVFSLMNFFTAFLGAVMFYVISRSSVDRLVRRKGWKKSYAALLVIVASFFVILLPITTLGAMLYDKATSVSSNLAAFMAPLQELDDTLQQRFHFSFITPERLTSLQEWATGFVSTLVNQGVNLFGSVIMMYFFLYFMLTNSSRMEAIFVFYLPFKKDQIAMFGNELKVQTFSNVVGIPAVAVVQGLIAYIAFRITGMQDAGFWSVITGFASVLPIIGTGLVWLPAGLIMLVNHQSWQGIFVLLWGAIVLSSMDNVVRFLLAKKMANIHPVVTVLGVIIGLKYFGITGLIFGPLLISYFLILLRIYYTEYRDNKRNKLSK